MCVGNDELAFDIVDGRLRLKLNLEDLVVEGPTL